MAEISTNPEPVQSEPWSKQPGAGRTLWPSWEDAL